jgi:hypothetical protein
MADDKTIIKATTPNSSKYDTKIDVYTSDPKGPHESIHIAVDSDSKTAHIIDTTNGSTEHTDVKCYLTTACMKHYIDEFDDNCYYLDILRWFRDTIVSLEDKKLYYRVAPIVVEAINKLDTCDGVYKDIYYNIIQKCVRLIEYGQYQEAYNIYKNNILDLESAYVKKVQL